MHNVTNSYTVGFAEIDKTKLAVVGGKGASLGELSRIKGIKVPPGFCATTLGYKTIIERTPGIAALLDQLTSLTIDDVVRVREISKQIRDAIEATPIRNDLEAAVADQLAKFGVENSYAVRSNSE